MSSNSAISANTRSSKAKQFKLHVTLEGADNYEQWKKAVQGQLFSLIKNIDMDSLTSASTLDDEHFKKHFNADYKEASKDADNNKQHPFEDDEFLQACLTEALTTGVGFMEWVYDVDTIVRSSLSEEINSKVSSPMGDFVGMLQQVTLAVGHIEISDPTDLEHLYSTCTMESCNNDFMEYTTKLAMYLRRLKAAGESISDTKKQRTLLRGLHPGAFETFIDFAEDKEWMDYDELLGSTIKKATNKKVVAKLNALKPGTHSVFATRSSHTSKTNDRRLARMEALLTTMTDKPPRSKGQCWSRNCKKPNCRFEHTGGKGAGNAPTDQRSRGKRASDSGGDDERRSKRRRTTPSEQARDGDGKYCQLHRVHGHSTSECHVVRSNPEIRKLYLGSSQPETINAMRARHDSDFDSDESINVTRVETMPQHVMTTRAQRPAPLDMWCMDSAATCMATWDRSRCRDVRKCNVGIKSADDDAYFVCTEVGVLNKKTGRCRRLTVRDVLISPKFPFHIISEIVLFEQKCTAYKGENSWQFFNSKRRPLLHASQRLLRSNTCHHVNSKLYFVDEAEQRHSMETATIAAARAEPVPLVAEGLPAPRAHILSTSALKASPN